MYCKLLKEAVGEIKGEVPEKTVETAVDLPIDAHIPENYIRNQGLRIDMYKKIAAISSIEDSYSVEEELEDRFGTIPQSVQNIIDTALIKNMASSLGIKELTQSDKGLMLTFEEGQIDMKVISGIATQSKGNALFSAGKAPYLIFRRVPSTQRETLDNIKFILQSMKELQCR